MKKYLVISALFLVSTFAAHTAFADDNDPYNRPGGYIGVGATRGVSFMAGTIDDAFAPAKGESGDSWGAHATAGYRFSKYIATEVEYEWMSGFNARAGGVAIASIETHTVTGNLKIIAPYHAFQPYFLVGAGTTFAVLNKHFFNNLDVDNVSFTARFGAGMDYYLTQNFSLNLGADMIVNSAQVSGGGNSNGRGLNYLAAQFGFGYRF